MAKNTFLDWLGENREEGVVPVSKAERRVNLEPNEEIDRLRGISARASVSGQPIKQAGFKSPAKFNRSLATYSGFAAAIVSGFIVLSYTQRKADPIRIVSFDVKLFRGNSRDFRGIIGGVANFALSNDNVKVIARLSSPGYVYLLALNPDGTIQFCPRSEANSIPGITKEIVYPRESDVYYGLSEGVGLQAFVLVVSHKPLPPFDSWSGRGGIAWKSINDDGPPWDFDGREFASLRGGKRMVVGDATSTSITVPAPLKAVASFLKQYADLDDFRLNSFSVIATEEVKPPAPGQDKRIPYPAK